MEAGGRLPTKNEVSFVIVHDMVHIICSNGTARINLYIVILFRRDCMYSETNVIHSCIPLYILYVVNAVNEKHYYCVERK